MKKKTKRLDNELYNIFQNMFSNENECEKAVEEAKIAFQIVKQDALFRKVTRRSHE